MATRLAIRIQECLDDLTPSERTLATYILDHQYEIVGLTAAELARAAGTSKSTTVRFFRSLGYESYESVRLQARSELNRHQPAGVAVSVTAEVKAGSPQAFLGEEVTAITRTIEGINSDLLRAVVERLALADRIWILALEDDAPLAPLAQNMFLSVRGNVNLLSDGLTSLFVRLVSVNPRDTVFVIALGQRSAEIKFAMEQVVSAGANMVVLTNLSLTKPVGSDLVIRCHANSTMPDGSVAAAVMTLQLLGRRLALRLAQRATSRKALLEGVREAARNRS